MSEEKKQITQAQFTVRVESEVAYLMYQERFKKDEAFAEANRYVSSKFVVAEKAGK